MLSTSRSTLLQWYLFLLSFSIFNLYYSLKFLGFPGKCWLYIFLTILIEVFYYLHFFSNVFYLTLLWMHLLVLFASSWFKSETLVFYFLSLICFELLIVVSFISYYFNLLLNFLNVFILCVFLVKFYFIWLGSVISSFVLHMLLFPYSHIHFVFFISHSNLFLTFICSSTSIDKCYLLLTNIISWNHFLVRTAVCDGFVNWICIK